MFILIGIVIINNNGYHANKKQKNKIKIFGVKI